MELRQTAIQIQEHGTHTVVNVNSNEKIEFSLTIAPKKFADPEVADLRTITESQRGEIASARAQVDTLSAMNDTLADEVAAAKKAARSAQRSAPAAKRRNR